MREIDGFCFLAQMQDFPNDLFLFGPNTRRRRQMWLNFTTNGLRPFVSREEAERAAKQCRQVGHLTNFRTGHIKIVIGETTDEWLKLLETSGPWIVITDAEGRQELRGQYREGCVPRAVPGGDMQMNGMCPLDNPDSVLYIRSECQRQFQAHSRIATFLLDDFELLP